MFKYLSQHPQIVPPIKKEIEYFAELPYLRHQNYAKGERWYRAHFPFRERLTPDKITFEATPRYLTDPLAPERIAALVPTVKLIVMLRSPTERAISHYFFEARKGRESANVMDALQRPEDKLAENQSAASNKIHVYYYKQTGLYAEQLRRYLKYFSREQILIISSESFFIDPETSLRKVFRFVGVDEEYRVPDLAPKNQGTNRTGVPPAIYACLNNYFDAPNRDLYGLVGEDYGW